LLEAGYDTHLRISGELLSRDAWLCRNKIDGTRSEVYVIGIVRDIKEKDGKKIIDLEDKTATIPVIFEPADADDLELDDVVAVKAISGGKVLFGKKVMKL